MKATRSLVVNNPANHHRMITALSVSEFVRGTGTKSVGVLQIFSALIGIGIPDISVDHPTNYH